MEITKHGDTVIDYDRTAKLIVSINTIKDLLTVSNKLFVSELDIYRSFVNILR